VLKYQAQETATSWAAGATVSVIRSYSGSFSFAACPG
jgi:hypothetical protein